MNDEIRALYQLAHECVYLLDLVVFEVASVFEEGLATLFSTEYARQLQPNYLPSEAKYDAAAKWAQEALTSSSSAIRELRGQGIRLSDFTPQQVRSVCPELSERICELLCTNYAAWDGRV